MTRQNFQVRLLGFAVISFLRLALLACSSETSATAMPTPSPTMSAATPAQAPDPTAAAAAAAATATPTTSPTTATATPTPAPMPTAAPAPDGSPAEIGVRYTHDLYTHCGIRYADFDGRRWLADPELGGPNSPPGWGNPSDPGTIELVARDRAMFLSHSGKQAFFRPTPEDYRFKHCL